MQVALLNFAYFFVEFAVARHIGSVSLFADSIDFLEDTSVNFLVLVALGWTVQRRAHRWAWCSPRCCWCQASPRPGWHGRSSSRRCRRQELALSRHRAAARCVVNL